MTQARLEANRRSAKKSTGPRTEAGKDRSRMNGLRYGNRSPEFRGVFDALAYASAGAILQVGESCLTRAQRSHPAYVEMVELLTEAEIQTIEAFRESTRRFKKFLKRTTKA